ncbi:hypothetical protein BCH_00835 [Brucella sp. 191011898]|nr:hypothetical protein BCH_00835 [Brucella sp. 191011898]
MAERGMAMDPSRWPSFADEPCSVTTGFLQRNRQAHRILVSGRIQSLRQIGDQVVGMLDTYGKADGRFQHADPLAHIDRNT